MAQIKNISYGWDKKREELLEHKKEADKADSIATAEMNRLELRRLNSKNKPTREEYEHALRLNAQYSFHVRKMVELSKYCHQ